MSNNLLRWFLLIQAYRYDVIIYALVGIVDVEAVMPQAFVPF